MLPDGDRTCGFKVLRSPASGELVKVLLLKPGQKKCIHYFLKNASLCPSKFYLIIKIVLAYSFHQVLVQVFLFVCFFILSSLLDVKFPQLLLNRRATKVHAFTVI